VQSRKPAGVYLDYNATTPVSPEVLDAMLPFLREDFGNPSSLHRFGRRPKDALRESRQAVAAFIGASVREVVFTGGGTEADNLALLGVTSAGDDGRRHVVTSAIEHHAVLNVAKDLEKRGWTVSFVEADAHGRITPERLEAALRPDTLLASVMFANNETGVVQPIRTLADAAHRVGALFHTDAVQACGKIPVDVEELGVDLLSLSAHKFYGPMGVGALYTRKNTPYKPVFRGGGQERARRPGTENVPGIVGLAEAARQAGTSLSAESRRLARLRDAIESRILAEIEGSHVNGLGAVRTPNTVNFRFDATDGERLVLELDRAGFAVSTGAACAAGAVQPSHVLVAMGLSAEEVQGSIRVSLGRYTEAEDAEAFVAALAKAVAAVRAKKDIRTLQPG